MEQTSTKTPSASARCATLGAVTLGAFAGAGARHGAGRLRAALYALFIALLLSATPAFAQIAYVQTTGLFDNASAASVTSNSFTKNPVVGDTIVVMAWTWNAGGYPTISVSDSSGNTYTQVSQPTTTGGGGTGYQNAALFYAPVTKTGANFKVTVSSAQSGSQIDAVAAEFSGVGVLDQFSGINGTSTTATISTPAATIVAGELVASGLGIYLPSDQYTSISASGGYTTLGVELDNLNNSAGGGAYQIAASAGVQSITWSSAGGTFSNWLATIATFQPASYDCSYAIYATQGLTWGKGTVNGTTVTGSGTALNPNTGVISSPSGVTLPAISPSSFPGGGSAITVPANGTLSPGTYTTVTAQGNLILTPGTYYIAQLNLAGSVTISPSGVAQLYIGTGISGGNNITLNASGTPTNLQIYLYSGASLQLQNNGSLTGLVYSPYAGSSVSIGTNFTLNGAFILGGSVSFGNNTTVTYSSATQSSFAALGACGGSGGGGGSTVGAFAAYETATTPASAYTGNINTKVAGSSYSIDVAALNNAKTAVNTSFIGSVLVQVIGTATSTPTLDANGCPSTSPQTLASPGTVNITNGRSTITFPAEPNAWRYAKVKVSYPAVSPTIISCSGDMYAIRPSTLSVVGNDAACVAPSCYLNNATTSGAPIQAAGAAFTLTATAYNAASPTAITTNYPGAGMSLTAASLAAIAPATVNGTLTPGSFSGSNGTATSSTAAYSEVGDFTVQLQDTGFATVDSTESANPAAGITSPVTAASCSGYYVCSGSTTFGRFVPAQFGITPAAPVAACNGFTYFGESFSTPFTLLAQNASGATTQNYVGALAKLALTTWSNFVFSASGNPAGTTLSSGATAPTGSWVAGSASISASQIISVPATPAGPSTVTILAQPVDSDGVTLASATAVTSPAATLYEGRARMVNAIGPETTDLLVPFLVEYWQSSSAGWQINTSDICTDASIHISAGTLAAAATCVRDTGNPGNSGAGCSGASPIANHKYLQGGVSGTDSNGVAGFAGNFNLWLAGPGAGNLGYVTVSATVPTWLQYNWTGTVGNPSAVATFGMPRTGPVLYRSEVYF